MDMEDLAVEVGKLVQKLHTSLARQEPLAAAQFRAAVLITMMPGSPVWNIQKQSEGDSCIMMLPESPVWNMREQTEGSSTIIMLGKK